jgi:hypothetical protein
MAVGLDQEDEISLGLKNRMRVGRNAAQDLDHVCAVVIIRQIDQVLGGRSAAFVMPTAACITASTRPPPPADDHGYWDFTNRLTKD